MNSEDFEFHRENYDGFCTSCKEITVDSGVEPDAEGIKCPECSKNAVMGVEQALLMGKLTIED